MLIYLVWKVDSQREVVKAYRELDDAIKYCDEHNKIMGKLTYVWTKIAVE